MSQAIEQYRYLRDMTPGDVFVADGVRHILIRAYDDAGPRWLTTSDNGNTVEWAGGQGEMRFVYCGRGRVQPRIVLEGEG